jgi:signal transduction protein with GAF and PtsI domain
MTLEAELAAACAGLRGLFGAAACSCALATEDGTELEFVAADGAGAEAIVGVRLPVSRGIAGFVAIAGQPIAIADVAADQRFARDVAESTEYVPSAILAAPLFDEAGETIGVLEVLDPVRPDGDSRLGAQRGGAADLAVLGLVATQVAAVVRLSRRLDLDGDDARAEVRLARRVLDAVAAYHRDEA